jgi:hypothetical protein
VNTDGGAGNTESSDRMILDRSMDELRLSEELFTRVLASSHAASRDATTATTTPSAESTPPRTPRCTWEKTRLPTRRPKTPNRVATPNNVIRATAVRAPWEWAHCTVAEANRAPR